MSYSFVFPSFLFFLVHLALAFGHSSNKLLQTYIIHLSPRPDQPSHSLEEWHGSFLPFTPGERRLVHSYGHAFSGFSARLSEEEVEEMRRKEGFIHARLDRKLRLHTTHSPAFLGLRQGDPLGLWNMSNYGEGVIIGMMDSGIWPVHPSFDDGGMPPPPARWKGGCEFNASFRCNNKIIGARVFNQGWMAMEGGSNDSTVPVTPLDDVGHGTATASVAAGAFVENANELGQATGTASGIAPRAHLAIYKVCMETGCYDSDLIAGIDSAVRDGVDVLSISIGGSTLPLYNDSIAIAAFGAVAKGVFVSCSAGNSGPLPSSTCNEAPWILTVGAGTLDRSIRATVRLGNGEEIKGESVYQPTNFSTRLIPLAYPAILNSSDLFAYFCDNNSLVGLNLTGKIVVCNGGSNTAMEKGEVVKTAGGAAMIIRDLDTKARTYSLPATTVADGSGNLTDYISNYLNPMATILFKGTLFDAIAPSVAAFSSRGPSTASRGILKPDIIGPGMNILSAWPGSSTRFKVVSGTSFSCPHLSGVAALLKKVHPDWSTAMIKSAMMTTADIINSAGEAITDNYDDGPASFLAIGAGQVNPRRASDPGLVFDLPVEDYVGYLCGLALGDDHVGAIVHRSVNCSQTGRVDGTQLNYPSVYVELGRYSSVVAAVERTVTNVGTANSTYEMKVRRPPGVVVEVEPMVLRFGEVGERRRFAIRFTRNDTEWSEVRRTNLLSWSSTDGSLTWASMDGKFLVRSVVSVYMKY